MNATWLNGNEPKQVQMIEIERVHKVYMEKRVKNIESRQSKNIEGNPHTWTKYIIFLEWKMNRKNVPYSDCTELSLWKLN